MSLAAKPLLATCVALAGAGVVPVTQAPSAAPHVAGPSYSLTAASTGLTNAPANLLNMVLSVPAWETQAMNRFADAMIATGSWQVWGPTNVIGFDEQDPPKLRAAIDMMVPIKPLSSVLGDQLTWWATANLPMNPGCAAQPGACPDRGAFGATALKVPMSVLREGYQFPTVTNPFTGEQTSWSGTYVKLERGAVAAALRGYLNAPPTGVETVSPGEFLSAAARVGRSVRDAFYPFVQNSEWFNGAQIGAAPLLRKLAPALCPSCNPDKPYDNPWLYDNYPPRAVPAAATPAAAAATATSSPAGAQPQADPGSPDAATQSPVTRTPPRAKRASAGARSQPAAARRHR